MKVLCVDVEGLSTVIKDEIRNGGIYEVAESDKEYYMIVSENKKQLWFNKNRFREVEKVEKHKRTEKTFKEVIADIKEGEVWENINTNYRLKEIDKEKGVLHFIYENSVEENGMYLLGVDERMKFELKRKKYSFHEAMVEYEKGDIEIERVLTGTRRKKINGRDYMWSKLNKEWYEWNLVLEGKEIRGEWFINA